MWKIAMAFLIPKKHIIMILCCCINILLIPLMFTLTSAESITQNDFRYVAYNDLLSTASRFSDDYVSTFSRFHFDVSKNTVFVGARDRLYRFSLQLDLMKREEWHVTESHKHTCLAKGQSDEDCHNYIMAIHSFKNKLFACGSYAFSPNCSWRNMDTLELIKEEVSIGKSPFNPRSNITTLMTDDGKMFVGSTIDFSGSDSVILRADLSVNNSKILRTKQYNNLELYEPQFVGSFEYGDFVYFVFREVSIEAASYGERVIYSRIGRVCKNDSGGFHIYKDNWTSFLKARLNCSLSDSENPFYFNEVQDIEFLAEEKELHAIFSTPDNSIQGSAICVFNMSSIEKAFSGPVKFQESSGSPIWHQKDLPQRRHYECEFNQKSSSSSDLMDISKYQLMANSVLSSTKNPIYIEKLEKFVRIAVTKIATKLHENVKIIFVANTNGFIKKISILPRTKQSCLIEVLEPETIGANLIETMQFLKKTESLYIGTKSSIYKIPVQHCHRYLSKTSCLNSMDPYCGWNDLTLVCGVSPNYDPLTTYWYQNATTCPILSDSDVDGGWSAWSTWYKCAQSEHLNDYEYESSNVDTCLCKTRTCNNPAPKGEGKKCEGHSIMVTNCTQHGGWSEWSAYGPCSQTCGIAIKTRRRTCSNPAPKHNGRLCLGNNQQEIYCTDLPPCSTTNINMQVDGGWSEFSEWSNCSAPCGGGFRIRERKCNSPTPQNNGLECIGCNIEYEECNKHSCNEVKKIGPWTNWLLMANSTNGLYYEKRFRYMCRAPLSDPSSLKITLSKEETRACKTDDGGGCHRVNFNNTCETNCEAPKDCVVNEHESKICEPEKIVSASVEIYWIFSVIVIILIIAIATTIFATKCMVEKRIQRQRSVQGSPHYLSSFPNQYSSLPTKDFVDNKPKRQPSFSGTSTMGRSKVTNNGTLNKSNNNLMNQNTPKILKYQNDTDNSTLKRNSALNNMRLHKHTEDDNDKY